MGLKEQSLWHSLAEGKVYEVRPLFGKLGTLLSSAVLLINNQGLSVQGPGGIVCLWFGNVDQIHLGQLRREGFSGGLGFPLS